MENGALHPLEIKMTATPKREDVAAFKVLKAVRSLKIGTGGLICADTALGILDKDCYIIPAAFI